MCTVKKLCRKNILDCHISISDSDKLLFAGRSIRRGTFTRRDSGVGGAAAQHHIRSLRSALLPQGGFFIGFHTRQQSTEHHIQYWGEDPPKRVHCLNARSSRHVSGHNILFHIIPKRGVSTAPAFAIHAGFLPFMQNPLPKIKIFAIIKNIPG